MDLKEDYPDYESYMNNFYRLYDDNVGFEALKNNVRTDKQKLMLNKLSNINNFGVTIDKIYKMLDEKQKSQPFLSEDNFILLNVDYHLNWLRSRAEALYKFNSMFFIPSDINKNGNIKLKKICDRLGYTNTIDSIKLKKYFFMDIRDAISHVDYNCELDEDGKFKFIVINTKNVMIKLDLHKMILITRKMIILTKIHSELIRYYH